LIFKTPFSLDGKSTYNSLKLSHKKDEFDGQKVWWAMLSNNVNDALEVHITEDGCIRLAIDNTMGFDCAFGRYNNENKVPIFFNHRDENQRFVYNSDNTISPLKRPDMVWGVTNQHCDHPLCLVPRSDNKHRLVFELPNFVPKIENNSYYPISSAAPWQNPPLISEKIKNTPFPMTFTQNGIRLCVINPSNPGGNHENCKYEHTKIES